MNTTTTTTTSTTTTTTTTTTTATTTTTTNSNNNIHTKNHDNNNNSNDSGRVDVGAALRSAPVRRRPRLDYGQFHNFKSQNFKLSVSNPKIK